MIVRGRQPIAIEAGLARTRQPDEDDALHRHRNLLRDRRTALTIESSDAFAAWLAALETRHLADLRVPEVTRALRALSSAYVERRHKVAAGATLDSAGKRAAFALYYGPLHFITVAHVVVALGAQTPAPS